MKKILDIYYYIQGWTRYYLYYKYSFLMRKHIKEQIQYRIISMDNTCFSNGNCKMCGCATTALQMCNKQCDKPCYPKILNRKKWNAVKKVGYYSDGKRLWVVNTNIKTFKA